VYAISSRTSEASTSCSFIGSASQTPAAEPARVFLIVKWDALPPRIRDHVLAAQASLSRYLLNPAE
ncbi:MAG: hypothetical protein M3Y22_06400, partial [Pseudomonadota bacterium]|nr:hypothetical protein [Pseudomonadota bacterium]